VTTPDLIPVPGNLSEYLQMWTVYEKPKDYPDAFVARLHLVGKKASGPTDQAFFGPSLENVRAQLPEGLVRMPRMPEDEPQIVEVWF
jgi:hypothetical protein